MSVEPQSWSSKLQVKPRQPKSYQELAEQVFRDFQQSETLHRPDRWKDAKSLFELLAGNPLVGEPVNEVKLVLGKDDGIVRRMAGKRLRICALT